MSDLCICTITRDLLITNGNFNLVLTDDAVAQQLEIRCKFFYQEWFLDQRLGIPYFRDVLVQNPDQNLIRSLFSRTVRTTPGVASVSAMTLRLDQPERHLYLYFSALLDSGTELVYEPFILET